MAPLKHFSTLFALVLTSSTLVSAGCYGNSGTSGRRAYDFLARACDDLLGPYTEGETKSTCFTYEYDNVKDGFWDFVITNKGGASEIDHATCMLYLGKEANGCETGGESTVDDWVYRYGYFFLGMEIEILMNFG